MNYKQTIYWIAQLTALELTDYELGEPFVGEAPRWVPNKKRSGAWLPDIHQIIINMTPV
jgi:hypothetical protein